ncbi:hypothetical protein T07_8877 [Trichinella nelsoni]|uniref:Uncharacterized protein n=1 Tax=Trichinella nelsoni TaxID=6336 RepID=A0A0V0SHU7_9BILA|nr:hypothetical protein T07_8877 [Trichinella nelsoni]
MPWLNGNGGLQLNNAAFSLTSSLSMHRRDTPFCSAQYVEEWRRRQHEANLQIKGVWLSMGPYSIILGFRNFGINTVHECENHGTNMESFVRIKFYQT